MKELNSIGIIFGLFLLLLFPIMDNPEPAKEPAKEPVKEPAKWECYETNFRFSDRLVYCTNGYYRYTGKRDSLIDAKIDSVLH